MLHYTKISSNTLARARLSYSILLRCQVSDSDTEAPSFNGSGAGGTTTGTGSSSMSSSRAKLFHNRNGGGIPSTSMYGLNSHDNPNSSSVIEVGSWPTGRNVEVVGFRSRRVDVCIVFGRLARTRTMICVIIFLR
jgi:hypothetical protein